MPNYKDINNKVHFLDSVEFEHLLPSGCIPITDSEAYALNYPPATLAQVQTTQLALMESSYQAANTAPIAYMSTTFQADANSQSLMAAVLTASGGSLPAGFAWFDVNNIPVAMTFAQLQGLAGTILLRGQPLFIHKQTQKAAIRAALDVATTLAVVW